MKLSTALVLAIAPLLLAGCDLVGDILEFGFWAGIIVVLLIVAIVWWAVGRFRRPRAP